MTTVLQIWDEYRTKLFGDKLAENLNQSMIDSLNECNNEVDKGRLLVLNLAGLYHLVTKNPLPSEMAEKMNKLFIQEPLNDPEIPEQIENMFNYIERQVGTFEEAEEIMEKIYTPDTSDEVLKGRIDKFIRFRKILRGN